MLDLPAVSFLEFYAGPVVIWFRHSMVDGLTALFRGGSSQAPFISFFSFFLFLPTRDRANSADSMVMVVCESSFTVAPPTFLQRKSPVLKPVPGRIYWNMVPLATSMSSFDVPSQLRKCVWWYSLNSIVPRVEQPCNACWRKIAGFLGVGAIVESVMMFSEEQERETPRLTRAHTEC